MFDDNAARRALHTLGEEPEPPIATTFDEVLRRGRRRVFIQRVSAVAGVAAVVGAIGVGAVFLRPGDPSGGVEVGNTDSSTMTTTTSQSSPPSTPQSMETTSESKLPTGWEQVPMPEDMDPSPTTCMQKTENTEGGPDSMVPSPGVVNAALLSAVQQVFGHIPTSTNHSASNSTTVLLTVELPMDNGNGQLQLEGRTYNGTPLAAANATVMVEGNCDAPYRRILDDGTVMQLYPTNTHSLQSPTRTLRIYQPDGVVYTLVSAGYSESDMTQGSDTSGKVVTGGRGKLPTTDVQFTEIAERLEANLR